MVVTYSETDSVKFNDSSVYIVRKLHFQVNLCEVFAEDKKQHYCGDLVLGWVVLQKTVFNHVAEQLHCSLHVKELKVTTTELEGQAGN